MCAQYTGRVSVLLIRWSCGRLSVLLMVASGSRHCTQALQIDDVYRSVHKYVDQRKTLNCFMKPSHQRKSYLSLALLIYKYATYYFH